MQTFAPQARPFSLYMPTREHSSTELALL